MPQEPAKPSHRQRMQIADRSDSGLRTVDRAYNGERLHETTRVRIARAAHELGLPPPPPAKEHAA